MTNQRDDEILLAAATSALRIAMRVENVERRSSSSARLGFAHVDYGRLFVRDQWTLFAIARELSCSVEDLLPPPEPTRETRSVWSELVSASERLLIAARALDEPIKSVVLLSAAGLGFRRVCALLPGRASFSVADDLARGSAIVLRLLPIDVRLLAGCEHPRLSDSKTRSSDSEERDRRVLRTHQRVRDVRREPITSSATS